MWRTADPVIHTVEAGENGIFASAIMATDAAPTRAHELVLRGLKPGTHYAYRIREGNQVILSDPSLYWFRTDAGRADTEYSFFVTGDIGAELPDGRQHLTHAMLRNVAPRADFGLLAGDIIYPDGESSAYDPQLMTPWRPLLASTPVWPALGNHDWHVDPDSNFCREWALPNNEHYYSFDYGNAHFIALDTADEYFFDEANQLAWLRADLQAVHNRVDWIVVYYHHPVQTCTYKGNVPEMAAKLWPIFAQYGVDIVFNGHAHTFERLFPILNGTPVNQAQNPLYVDPQGTVYVVSGCGGKVKVGEPTRFCGPTAAFVDERILFTQVFVSGRTMNILTLESATGAVVDWAQIRKTQPPTDVTWTPLAPALRQNVPNPFNPSTAIPFAIERPGHVTLQVYRPDGRRVATLLDREMPAGSHEVAWDGRDERGESLASGSYLCRMETTGLSWSIKMVLLR